MSDTNSLRITEIFHSLQGEAQTVGKPTVFIRLTGCPLRCQYCDTEYAFHGGSQKQLTDILLEVKEHECSLITVTGGEPLAQPHCLSLLRLLCDSGYQVSLETSGALAINDVDSRVSIVMDLKTPGSLEESRNLYANVSQLKAKDQLKFVLCSRGDYDWAKSKIIEYNLTRRVGEILMSPSHLQLRPIDLAEWILYDKLAVRMQLQLHKLIWDDTPGH